MNHVIEKVRRAELKRWGNNIERAEKTIRQRIAKYAEKNIVGVDFNPDLVKASKMNMVMNNDGAGGLYRAAGLEVEGVEGVCAVQGERVAPAAAVGEDADAAVRSEGKQVEEVDEVLLGHAGYGRGHQARRAAAQQDVREVIRANA